MNVLVFEFLKRRPVKFSRDEEVEVSLPSSGGSGDVFVSRISQQSYQKLYLQIPPQVIRRSTFEPDMDITVRFTRNDLLGTSKARILEILPDENPPLFVVQLLSDILWEEIVPARLAEPPVKEKPPGISLVIGDGDNEYAGTAREVTSRGFLLTSSVCFEPHIILTIEIPLNEPLRFNAEVLSSLRRNDSSLYEVTVSLSELIESQQERLKEALNC